MIGFNAPPLAIAIDPTQQGTEVPKGTEIEIRLKSKVGTASSKLNDSLEAVVISPVLVGEYLAIPTGTRVTGTIKKVSPAASTNDRAILLIEFQEWVDSAGNKGKLSATLFQVDNAREMVDENGQISGILGSETISSKLDKGLENLAQHHAGLAELLEAAKKTVMKEPDTEISYGPGVEMTLKLAQPLKLSKPMTSPSQPVLQPIPDLPALSLLVNSLPFQTRAVKPPKDSDITNLMFLGSKEQLESAFKEAGWSTAEALNSKSELETIRAVAEDRGYKEAPMSMLLLDGKAPDLVYQKQNDTFAKRHHLRIWQRPEAYQGETVWVSSSTHDIGIDFSAEDRTFIHKIDPHIDLERKKVVNDLLFTGKVKSVEYVERTKVPKEGNNATGDKLLTDGKMAVILLR
ncbi:MAG: LssY C-terminal domain-containing protein [Terriglobia bacterium]